MVNGKNVLLKKRVRSFCEKRSMNLISPFLKGKINHLRLCILIGDKLFVYLNSLTDQAIVVHDCKSVAIGMEARRQLIVVEHVFYVLSGHKLQARDKQ